MENPSKTLFDCQRMFRHACAFAECADMAEAKFCHDTADIEWYITPAVVNSAFACEVYIKALLQFYDIRFMNLLPPKERHEIKKLYGLLPEESEEWIKQRTLDCYGGALKNAFGLEQLDDISDAFIDWRYSYEIVGTKRASMQINIGFLTVFRNALREVCCRLFFGKTWEEYLAN